MLLENRKRNKQKIFLNTHTASFLFYNCNFPKKMTSIVFSFSSMVILAVALFNTATGVSPRSGKAYHTTLSN